MQCALSPASIIHPRFSQKINHFNGMLEICRKKNMARNLMKMARMFPEHYDFFPRTFVLPSELQVGGSV